MHLHVCTGNLWSRLKNDLMTIKVCFLLSFLVHLVDLITNQESMESFERTK